MKTLVLSGVMLALALVLGIVLWSRESAKQASFAERERAAQEAEKLVAQRLDAPATDASALEVVTTDAEGRTDATPAPTASTDLVVVGRVTSDGTCTDEEVEVFVTKTDFEVFDVDDFIDGARGAALMKNPLLTRARAEKDGTFRVSVPQDAKKVLLHVRGRYLYSLDPLEVDAQSGKSVAIAARCGACIEGRVEPPVGASPIAEKLEVELGLTLDARAAERGDGINRKTHLVDGQFRFRAVPTKSALEVEVLPEAYPAATSAVEPLAPGRTRQVDVRLVRGGVLRGRVVGPDGTGVAAAEVRALRPGRWFGFDDKAVRKRKSTSDGSFELTAVALGKMHLSAEKEGLIAGDPLKLQVADGAVVEGLLVTLGTGNSIEGAITWPDGKPAHEVKVVVEFDKAQMYGMTAFNAARGAEGSALADADGRFAVRGLGAGPFTVKAEVETPDESDDAKEKLRARKDDVKPNTKGLTLVLAPPSGIRGRVVDTQGEPLKKYTIVAQGMGKGLLKELGQDHVEEEVESESGAFLLQVPRDGDWQLRASSAGYAGSAPYDLTLPLAGDKPEIVLTLAKAARVSGIVRDPQGVAVPGAVVENSTGEPSWMRRVSRIQPPTATTDAEGRFTLEGLKGGALKLFATAKDHAKSIDTPVDVAPGEERSGVVITLRVGGRLTGEVFDAGKPASGMMVQATFVQNSDQFIGTTDASGRFALEHLEPGSYTIVAMRTSALAADEDATKMDEAAIMSQLKMASAEIVDGIDTHVVLGAPPADPVHVHGRVTHGGEALPGLMIVFMGESKDMLAGMKTASVGADGSYAVDLDAPGRYSVTLQSFSGKPGEQSAVEFRRVVPAVKEFALDFVMPNARISGRVYGPDGAHAADVSIGLQSESGLETGSLFGGQFVMKSTDAEGRFDLSAIKPGVYTVAAGGSPFGGLLGDEKTFGRATKKHVVVKDGEWVKDLDFRLEKPGVVVVTVVGPDDRPVAGASVFARDAEGQVVDALSLLSSGVDGTANYSGLAPGRYTFSARDETQASADSPNVEVEAGATKKVKIALAKGTTLVVRVVDDKDAVVDAQLFVLDAAGRDVAQLMGMAEMQKSFMGGGTNRDEKRIGPLAAGKYRVRAVREDGKTEEKPVTLSGQAERSVKLQF